MPDFRTETTRSEPVRPGRVVRFNNDTLEYAIAAARLTTALGVVALLAGFVAVIWTGDMRWALTDGLTATVTYLAGWFGFRKHANEEWSRNAPPEQRPDGHDQQPDGRPGAGPRG